VWLSRAVVLALGAGGLALAWRKESVFAQVLDAWNGLAAGLGPAIILACLWRRTSRIGVIIGMITGVVMVQTWNKVMDLLPRISSVFTETMVADIDKTKLFVTVLMNLVLVVLISLLFPARTLRGSDGKPVGK
jgi:Na+/proline symporter